MDTGVHKDLPSLYLSVPNYTASLCAEESIHIRLKVVAMALVDEDLELVTEVLDVDNKRMQYIAGYVSGVCVRGNACMCACVYTCACTMEVS